jgi:hypothetical protein
VQPLVADDERREVLAASRTPACSICTVSAPIAFIFEWNSTHSTPSPRSTRLAPGFDLTIAERSRALRSSVSRLGAGISRRRTRALADRLHDLERPQLPAEAPAHHAVHVVGEYAIAGVTAFV